MKDYLKKVMSGDVLSESESEDLMKKITHKAASNVEAAMILTAMQMRGEHPSEVLGFLSYLKDHQVPVKPRNHDGIIDICGTGGDRSGTFNISTASSFVLAGGGVPVAKHGGRSVSSKTGSTDVLEALGVAMALEPEQALKHIEAFKCAFLPAPAYNPTFKEYGTLRKEMGIQSYFNILGPLLNPISPIRQVMGVYKKDLIPLIAKVMVEKRVKNAIVVHSDDGLDEFSISAPSNYAHIINGEIEYKTITPEQCGIPRSKLSDLKGGCSNKNAQIIESILKGKIGPKRDVVLMNAAAGFLVSNKAKNFTEGISMAKHSIDSGNALKELELLRKEKTL